MSYKKACTHLKMLVQLIEACKKKKILKAIRRCHASIFFYSSQPYKSKLQKNKKKKVGFTSSSNKYIDTLEAKRREEKEEEEDDDRRG